jgi:hypothetical protein
MESEEPGKALEFMYKVTEKRLSLQSHTGVPGPLFYHEDTQELMAATDILLDWRRVVSRGELSSERKGEKEGKQLKGTRTCFLFPFPSVKVECAESGFSTYRSSRFLELQDRRRPKRSEKSSLTVFYRDT